jgi:hypothetical protein
VLAYSPILHGLRSSSALRHVVTGTSTLCPNDATSCARHLPRAPLPVAGVTCPRDDLRGHLDRHYPAVIAPTGSCAPPLPSPRLRFILFRSVFAGCRTPLPRSAGSRRYLCIPYRLAWSRTPARPAGALIRFFPADDNLTSIATGSARTKYPAKQLHAGDCSRGCRHFIMFRLADSLDLPVAPTATTLRRAARPFTSRNSCAVTRHKPRYRYVSDTDNRHGGTFTRWNAALSAAHTIRNHKSGIRRGHAPKSSDRPIHAPRSIDKLALPTRFHEKIDWS